MVIDMDVKSAWPKRFDQTVHRSSSAATGKALPKRKQLPILSDCVASLQPHSIAESTGYVARPTVELLRFQLIAPGPIPNLRLRPFHHLAQRYRDEHRGC